MQTVMSFGKKAKSRPRLFRKAPEYTEGSIKRSKIESYVLTVVPAHLRPERLADCASLPAIYARFRLQKDVDGDEFGLARHQLAIEAGVTEAPILGQAGHALRHLPDTLAGMLARKELTFKVAMRTLRVAATVYRLFQLWALRGIKERLALQLEPNFVRDWMAFANEGEALVTKLHALHLEPRLGQARFRQQRIRARNYLDNGVDQALEAHHVRASLKLLVKLEFIRPGQHFQRVPGHYWVPRYELVDWPIPDLAPYSYTNLQDYYRKREKRTRAKIARKKAAKRNP